MASERNHFPPPSYDYGMEMTESPISIHAAPENSNNLPADKYIMRDEERYPTVVEIPTGLIPYEPPPGETSATSANTLSPLTRNLAALPSQKPEPEELPEKVPVRKIWGVPRRRFFMIATGLAVLAISAIIIGVAVGVVTKNKHRKRYPAITASGVFTGANATSWHMHIVHTNITTGAVTLKSNNGTGSWSAEQSLNLSVVPAVDAPISATSVLGNDGTVYLNLFYIHDNNIVLANITCVAAACTTISNNVISNGITYPLHTNSAIDSVYINSTMGYRIFYHNSDKYITQLGSTGDGTWDHGSTISGKALSGSSICASVLGDSGGINVIYVDDKDKELYNVQFDQNRWRNRRHLQLSPIQKY